MVFVNVWEQILMSIGHMVQLNNDSNFDAYLKPWKTS